MIPWGALSLLFGVLGSGAKADVATGAELGASGGLLAIEPEEASEPAIDTRLTAHGGLRVHSERTQFILRYSPSIYMRVPNIGDFNRPLFFHRLVTAYSTLPSPRSSFVLEWETGAGELSYSDLRRVFEPGSSTVRSSVLDLVQSSASANYEYAFTQRHGGSIQVVGGARAPLSALTSPGSTESGVEEIQTSYDIEVTLGESSRLTRRDALGAQLSAGYFQIFGDEQESEGFDLGQVSTSLVAVWQRQLSGRSELLTTAGGSYSQFRPGGPFQFLPLASLNVKTAWHGDGQLWQTQAESGVQGFFDAASGTYRPLLYFDWDLEGQLGQDFTTGLSLFASTNATMDALEGDRYESILSFELPQSWRLANNLYLDFGARSSLRAGHATALGSVPLQLELVGFVGLRAALGTGQNSDWLF